MLLLTSEKRLCCRSDTKQSKKEMRENIFKLTYKLPGQTFDSYWIAFNLQRSNSVSLIMLLSKIKRNLWGKK